MPELDEVLTRAVRSGSQQLGDAQPDSYTAGAVWGAVRSRRRTRQMIQGAVALPVAAGLALGGWALAGQLGTPAPVASQDSVPAPEPNPTQSAPEDATPAPQALPSETGLPDRLAAPAGILDQAGPGWVLAAYATTPGEDGSAPNGTAIVLSAPDGSLYELTRLSATKDAPAGAWFVWDLLDWDAKAGTALVTRGVAEKTEDLPQGLTVSSSTLLRLDLRTGAQTPVPGGGAESWGYLGAGSAGNVWARANDTGMRVSVLDASDGWHEYDVPGEMGVGILSPTGDRVLLGSQVLDLGTGKVSAVPGLAAGLSCTALSWWTSSSVLASCESPTATYTTWLEQKPRLVEIGLDGSSTVLHAATAADLYYPGSSAQAQWIGDRHVILSAGATVSGYVDDCGGVSAVLDVSGPDATMTPLAAADDRGLGLVEIGHEGQLVGYGSTPGGCGDETPPWTVTVVDLGTGAARLAVPTPVGVDPMELGLFRTLSGFALWH